MTTFVSPDVQRGIDTARKSSFSKRSRLRLHVGDAVIPIVSLNAENFSVDADHAPHMRGLVDIFDGARHLAQALIVTSHEENGLRVFEIKRSTKAAQAPAIDYWVSPDAPKGLLS